MRKSIKTLVAVIFTLLMIFGLSSVAFAEISIPSATSDFYVNDFAGIFSDDEKSQLMNSAVSLSDEYDGIQVVVTTVESLDGNTIESYAFEMYNRYRIGKDDMGLLILLSTGDRQIRVEVGKAMEAYITDSKAGSFIDKYAIPSLKENRFNEGLIILQEAFISEIIRLIDLERSSQVVTPVVQSVAPVPETTPILETTNNTELQRSPSEISRTSSNESSIIYIALFISLFFAMIVIIVALILVIYKKKQENSELSENNQSLSESLRISKSNLDTQYKNYQKQKETLTKQSERERSELKYAHEREVKRLNGKIDELSDLNRELHLSRSELVSRLSTMDDWQKRVVKLHPGINDEVNAMIEQEIKEHNMQEARKVDSLISGVINLSSDRTLVSKFSSALQAYSALTDTQKTYVTSDIQKLRRLQSDSVQAQQEYERKQEEERIQRETEQAKKAASDALQSVNAIISSISTGKSANLDSLRRARKIYDSLNFTARKYFDKSVLDKLDRLIREAEADYEREQEIERDKQRAAVAMASISGTINYISRGSSSNLSRLKDARRVYDGLDSKARQYVDKSTIDKLDRLLMEAKRDKEEEEEAERRRRASSYSSFSHSSSSHHSSSSFGGHSGGFGGFGGHSGGGGASRGF